MVTALRAPLAAPQAFPSGGSLWIVGGEQGSKVTDALLRVNLSSGRIVPSGTFEEPLAESGVAADGGSAYLAGGWTGDQYASGVLKFTPPSTVSLVSRLPVGVRSPAVALVGSTLYVAGGQTAQGPSTAVSAVDVDSGGMTSLGQLPQPVDGGVLLPVGSKLYLVGGRTTGGKASGAVILIDPATGSATLAGRIPRPLVGHRRSAPGRRRSSSTRRRDDLQGLREELAGRRVHVLVRRVHAVLVTAHPLPLGTERGAPLRAGLGIAISRSLSGEEHCGHVGVEFVMSLQQKS